MAEKVYLSSSDKETKEIAKTLINSLTEGTVICLVGSMAVGKTTFSQGIGSALGISRLISPTYMIMREYLISDHSFLKRLFHLDLYRLKSAEDIKAFDIDEIWNNPENLVLIEWPETLTDLLPTNRIDIFIKATGDTQREITITKHQ